MTLSITKSSYREFQVMAGRMTPPKPQSRQRQDEVAPEMTSRQRQRQCSLNLVEMFSKSHRMFSKSHQNVQYIRFLSLYIVTPIRCTLSSQSFDIITPIRHQITSSSLLGKKSYQNAADKRKKKGARGEGRIRPTTNLITD